MTKKAMLVVVLVQLGGCAINQAQPISGLKTDGVSVYGTVPSAPPNPPVWVIRIKPNGHGLTFLQRGTQGVAVDNSFIYYLGPDQMSILQACK